MVGPRQSYEDYCLRFQQAKFALSNGDRSFVVKIRLTRVGAKKAPHYRIVAVDSRARRDGMPIETLGYYNPRSKELTVDREAVEKWTKNGAQTSDTVASLLRRPVVAPAAPAAGASAVAHAQ
jgi:small subunit ribosomal protein S16